MPAIATLVGYAGIFTTVVINGATLFDYNGPNPGPAELSGLELMIVLEFVLLGSVVAFLLRRASSGRQPGWFKFWHAVPLAIAGLPLCTALFALVFAVSEIVN